MDAESQSGIKKVAFQASVGESRPLIPVVLSLLASAYLRLVGWTSRIVWLRRDIRARLEAEGTGIIYVFWHNRQAFLTYLHAGDRLHPLISRSRDGDIIAGVCRHFGLMPTRGSSSRGGTEAALELLTWVEKGDRVSLTPDGPRGPVGSVQPGVLYLAQKTAVPVVPVAYGAKRRWIFNSWDRFMLPKPFNRISMVYGEPLYIRPEEPLDQAAARLKAALDTVSQDADQAVGALG